MAIATSTVHVGPHQMHEAQWDHQVKEVNLDPRDDQVQEAKLGNRGQVVQEARQVKVGCRALLYKKTKDHEDPLPCRKCPESGMNSQRPGSGQLLILGIYFTMSSISSHLPNVSTDRDVDVVVICRAYV